jgi:hypothetical protein
MAKSASARGASLVRRTFCRLPRTPRHRWQEPDTEPASEDHERFSFAGKKSIEYEAFSFGIMKRDPASPPPEPA